MDNGTTYSANTPENLLAAYLGQNPESIGDQEHEIQEIASIVEELRLWDSIGQGPLQWKVQTAHASNLHNLPEKKHHSGNFAWDGPEPAELPAWLWDTAESRTIATREEQLTEGYMAISYTWGRYAKGSTKASGTPWNVPVIDNTVYPSMLSDLKEICRSVPCCRYFWIDVLCINQDDPAEREAEIAKQAAIFGNAKGVLVYLWTLDLPYNLPYVVANVGNLLLWALTFSQAPNQQSSDFQHNCKFSKDVNALLDGTVQLEPWFSSLWALQEMVVCPSSIWITKEGSTCNINGSIVTTRLFMLAVKLLCWACNHREMLWQSKWASEYMVHDDNMGGANVLDGFSDLLNLNDERRKDMNFESNNDFNEQMRNRLSYRGIEENKTYVVRTTDRIRILDGAPAWIKQRRHEEYELRQSVETWKHWAFSQTGLSLCLSATRTEILVAGTFRQSTERRAAAIMAALKISYRHKFVELENGDDFGPGGLPTSFLNLILELEGLAFFYVSHMRRTIKVQRNENHQFATKKGGLLGSYDGLIVDDGTRHSIERTGLDPVIRELTSMLPSCASFWNVDSVNLEQYGSFDAQTCHLHPDGSVHLLAGTLLQDMFSSQDGTVRIRRDGTAATYGENIPLPLAQLMVQTNDFVLGSLGQNCRVKFLPLLVRLHNEANISSPLVIGLILVSPHRSRATDSLTYWHKFGLYTADRFDPSFLNWRDGILVGAIGAIERSVSKNIGDCVVPNSRTRASSIVHRFRHKARKWAAFQGALARVSAELEC